ncbi:ATP-dependent helicase HrpB [Thermosphaera sp.]
MTSPVELPIYAIRGALLDAARGVRRWVAIAPTGSGKSTQVPQMLRDGGLPGQIVVLQPRRIAARLLAARVAQERGGQLGDEVGYQVRFEGAVSDRTRILYVTEGVLLRRMMNDPDLTGIGAVLFDEFHERHVYGDVTLARVRQLQQMRRPDLCIGVMSATLAAEPLASWMAPCPILRAEGRMYPVDIAYLPQPLAPAMPIWEAAARAFERVASAGIEGHTLVFMPGAYEIARTLEALQELPAARRCALLPLHGELPPAAQDEAIASSARPKIIVATNVAETSLTIEGVRLVIDSGLARIPRHDPRRGINTLYIEPISRSAADQRAGRAGRTGPGRCLRLWTEREHRTRPAVEIPEIRRLELSEIVLALKAVGVEDLASFPWFEPPTAETLAHAEGLLRDLGAVDDRGALTPLGRRMAEFPVHPRYARMLIEAGRRRAVRPVALFAALTQGRDLLRRRADRETREGRERHLGTAPSDFFVLARAWSYARESGFNPARCERLGIHAATARHVEPLHRLFLQCAERAGLPLDETPPSDDDLCKCILAGFADHVARRLDGGTLRCAMTHGRRGRLDRASVVQKAPLLVAAEVAEISGRDVETVLSLATAIREEWLEELFPGAIRTELVTIYDRVSQRVMAIRRRSFRGLILEEREAGEPAPELAARCLADAIQVGDLKLARWDDAVEQWIARIQFIAREAPEAGVEAFTENEQRRALEQICLGAFSQKDVRDRPVLPVLQQLRPAKQRETIDRLAPEYVRLPSGRRARVCYRDTADPYLAARIQDLYGLEQTPRILGGRYPLTIRILAPNERPVQITRDLRSFWQEVYPRVRGELRRRYPKHEWR